jgi:predicted secreted hydrolase
MPSLLPRALALIAVCASLLGVATPVPLPARVNGFENARLPWQFVFPRDHAAHPGFEIEWWYYTGHLRAAGGRRFGYELTFFREALRAGDPTPGPDQSKWRGTQVYPAHLALTDESGKRFVFEERFAREALGMGHASSQTLDVAVNDWTLHGTSPFVLHADGADVALDLQEFAEKPPAVHGHDGVSVKAACPSCASHYYSMTRLRTSGSLRYQGAVMQVAGTSWMDHEFGSEELQPNQAGWDWFSIQLDDRREIMDYRLRQTDGSLTPESSGSLVDANGAVRHLERDEVLVDVTGRWTSPHTNATYPSGWHLRVPSANLDLVLVPVLADQELVAPNGGTTYWEGSVDVQDATTHTHLGDGYVELTGYTAPLSL